MYGIDHAMQLGSAGATAPRETLLFVGPADGLNECTVRAIEHEFPALVIEHVASFPAARGQFDPPVRLVLAEASYLAQNRHHTLAMRQHHPATPIAAFLEDRYRPGSLPQAMLAGLIQGVVPIYLKVDVWLAVLQLLLRGVPYFPSWMLQAGKISQKEATVMTKANRSESFGSQALNGLTARETDILELIARGLPNKLIAVELNISEYTVKVHIQNILRKLGVYNRTAAAAIFHAGAKP